VRAPTATAARYQTRKRRCDGCRANGDCGAGVGPWLARWRDVSCGVASVSSRCRVKQTTPHACSFCFAAAVSCRGGACLLACRPDFWLTMTDWRGLQFGEYSPISAVLGERTKLKREVRWLAGWSECGSCLRFGVVLLVGCVCACFCVRCCVPVDCAFGVRLSVRLPAPSCFMLVCRLYGACGCRSCWSPSPFPSLAQRSAD
jgi:hypothetical protein